MPPRAKANTLTPDERVRASEARKVESGGRRLPGSVLDANAANALSYLESTGYAKSATSCIARALTEAARKFMPSKASN